MTPSVSLLWIPLLPLLGAAFLLIVGRKLSRRWVHLAACGSILGALICAMIGVFHDLYPQWLAATASAAKQTAPQVIDPIFDWIVAGPLSIKFALLLDPLSGVMVLVVTFVGFLIHLYSTGYMSHEADYARFFGYLNLFTGSMLLLLLGDSLATMFVGWEGVGLCSYLLIGFWYDKNGTEEDGDENASAGKKAFIVNRIGDLAFLAGMFVLFSAAGTLNIEELFSKSQALTQGLEINGATISIAGLAGLLLFIGATGKSAQIPLYVWLPDAMAGPTPVSALIHAATMVTAGVYMVVRLNFLYMLSPAMMGLVALVGAATALFAATIGFAQNDIKKVLAYSTVSQLGYMFLGAGVGAFSAAIFHVFTHAFFKACLFLGAGAVIHALSGEQDMRQMGGLRRRMPLTHLTFLVSTLSIAGVPVFAGFFSKDEILWRAISSTNGDPAWAWIPKATYVMALAGAICTAFYMFRLYYLTFSGRPRTDAKVLDHLHAPGPAMTVPLLVLAFGAVVLGFLGLPGLLAKHNHSHLWLSPIVERGHRLATASSFLTDRGLGPVAANEHLAHNHGLEAGLMALSVIVALVGILSARRMYNRGAQASVEQLVDRIPRLHRWVAAKYYIDEVYDWLIVRPFKLCATLLYRLADRVLIDLIVVNGTAAVVNGIGRLGRLAHNGNLQHYLAVLLAGLAAAFYWASEPPDEFEVATENGAAVAGSVAVGESLVFRPAEGGDRDLEYRWDFDGDGKWDYPASATQTMSVQEGPVSVGFTRDREVTWRFSQAGQLRVRLEVRDRRWRTTTRASRKIVVVGTASTDRTEVGRRVDLDENHIAAPVGVAPSAPQG